MAFSHCRTGRLAAAEQPDSTLVFAPGTAGYVSMRIPALVATKKGTLLAFCEARVGSASDWAEMDLLMRRSTDKGKTWSAPVVVSKRMGPQPNGNPTPIAAADGTVHLVFQRDYATAWYMQSTDDGLSWSEPKNITYVFDRFKPQYDWKVLAPGPGHGIELSNGRLLVPVWMSASEKLLPHRSHSPTCIATIYSDDAGKTWQRGDIVADNTPAMKNPNENMAVQLSDGRVMLNIRFGSDRHRRGVSYSGDGATGWTKPVFDENLFDPVCMASIIRVPGKNGQGKGYLLFANPDSRHLDSIPRYPRKNLSIKLSADDGKTWTVNKVLDTGYAGYSDLALGPDGTLYCLYESNTTSSFNYSQVLKSFSLKWLGR
jgi:sialidase-1